MKEEELIRISMIGSILGIFALYIIALNISSISVKIGEVTGSMTGSVVRVEGEVNGFYEHRNGHLFFDLEDGTGSIRVVIWDNVAEELEISGMNVSGIRDGAVLEITGTVERYRGELELIPLRSQVRIVE